MLHTTPTRKHLISFSGDMRERAVPCRTCQRPTWNICAECDGHCACPDAGAGAAIHDALFPATPALEDIATVLADDAAQAMVRNVHATMDEVIATIPDGTPPETVRDLKATVGMACLLADVAEEHPASHSAWQMLASTIGAVRVKSRALVTGTMAVLMVAAFILASPAGTESAAAAVTGATQVTKPTVTTGTVRVPVRVTVTSKNRVTGLYQASVWVGNRAVGYGQAKTASFVVTAAVPVAAASKGAAVVTVRDENDGKCLSVTVTVMRRTSLAGAVTVAGYGIAYVSATVRHWTGSGWVASQVSPVVVQRQVGGVWVNVRTLTTSMTGTAAGYVALPAGPQYVRLLRPAGATVTPASTRPVLVHVPSPDGEGCGCESPGAGD